MRKVAVINLVIVLALITSSELLAQSGSINKVSNAMGSLMGPAKQIFQYVVGFMTLVFGALAGYQIGSGSQASKTYIVGFLGGLVIFALTLMIV
jgi:hypothetical protein